MSDENFDYDDSDDNDSETIVVAKKPVAPVAVVLRMDSRGYDVVRVGQWPRGKTTGQYLRIGEKMSAREAHDLRNNTLREMKMDHFVNEWEFREEEA